MTNVKVWLKGQYNPIEYTDIEYCHESFRKLEIVQEELYKTVTIVIYKDSISRYAIYEKR